MLILFPFFYYGLIRTLGRSRARAFAYGSFLFGLALETTFVICGLKNYYWYSINNYYKHYPLGGYIIWLGVVPLAALILWTITVASSYIIAESTAGKQNPYVRSSIAGCIALIFYLLAEPVGITNHWWVWNAKNFYFLDIPVFNLLYVFLAVFVFTLVYRATIMERKDTPALSTLEQRTLRKFFVKSKKATRNLTWPELRRVFLFRLALGCVTLGAVMTPIITVLWAVANRGHIKPGW